MGWWCTGVGGGTWGDIAWGGGVQGLVVVHRGMLHGVVLHEVVVVNRGMFHRVVVVHGGCCMGR